MSATAWSDLEAKRLVAPFENEADRTLAFRLYSCRLIGGDPDLVLHGGGNTSVKVTRTGPGGEPARVMHVKGSGHDLASIDSAGMPAVYIAPLEQYRGLDRLDDREMVAALRVNLMDPKSPTPSVEALLHAWLPGTFVDHTHATAALVIANQPNAAELAADIYGDDLTILPYVMPGFDLSIAGDRAFKTGPVNSNGLFLVNHGLFTQGDTAQASYERMLDAVALAEAFLEKRGIVIGKPEAHDPSADGRASRMAEGLRLAIAAQGGGSILGSLDFRRTASIVAYSQLDQLADIAARGTATPDHVIRTKPFPLIAMEGWDQNRLDAEFADYGARYRGYFSRNAAISTESKTMLDTLPRVVIVPGLGVFGLGATSKAAAIVSDLVEQTARIVLAAELLGRYAPLAEADLFQMEYWSLEQAKLTKG